MVGVHEHIKSEYLSIANIHLSGHRQRVRALVKELSPECLDTVGHTPLMYAVFGRQAKVYFHDSTVTMS